MSYSATLAVVHISLQMPCNEQYIISMNSIVTNLLHILMKFFWKFYDLYLILFTVWWRHGSGHSLRCQIMNISSGFSNQWNKFQWTFQSNDCYVVCPFSLGDLRAGEIEPAHLSMTFDPELAIKLMAQNKVAVFPLLMQLLPHSFTVILVWGLRFERCDLLHEYKRYDFFLRMCRYIHLWENRIVFGNVLIQEGAKTSVMETPCQ